MRDLFKKKSCIFSWANTTLSIRVVSFIDHREIQAPGLILKNIHFLIPKPQPSFIKKFILLIEDFNNNHNKGYTKLFYFVPLNTGETFHDIFEEISSGKVTTYKTIVFLITSRFLLMMIFKISYAIPIIKFLNAIIKFHLKNGYAKSRPLP